MQRHEDPYNLCDEIISESVQYIKRRNPKVNVTMLERSSRFVDFGRLVFAPNVLVTGVGSSWALWSTLANTNHVVSVLPAMNMNEDKTSLPPSYTLLDVNLMMDPGKFEDAAKEYGLPFASFSNSTQDREVIMNYFRGNNTRPSGYEMSIATVVTAFFKIDSNHTVEEYQTWMENMLSLQDAMVICELNAVICNLRKLIF